MNLSYYVSNIMQATSLTLQLMVLSLAIGFILAVLLTSLSKLYGKIVNNMINGFIFFMRGTPLLIQFFLIYYGLSQFAWVRESLLWSVIYHPFACAVIALAINSAAYSTVLLRGAMASIPAGELYACQALGMSKSLYLRRIIWPRALRLSLPSYTNEVIMILKGTSLASTITLLELTGMTKAIVAETYLPIEFFLVAGAIYLTITGIIVGLFRVLERKYLVFQSA